MLRRIIGHGDMALDFGRILAEGKVVLLKLARGRFGAAVAYLVASQLVSRIRAATLPRSPEGARPFFVYIDKAGSMAHDEAVAQLLSEARKFRVGMFLAAGSANRRNNFAGGSLLTWEDFKSMTLQRVFAIWLSVVLVSAQAAPAVVGPDELAEAARLAAHAQTLEDQCQYRESGVWLDKAVNRLKSFRSADVSQSRAAGSLLAQLEIRKRGPRYYDWQEQSAARLLAAARAESASRMLGDTAAPGCDARFARLEQETVRRRAGARQLIAKGEHAVSRYEKKDAIRLFERAAALNAEAPGLADGLANARALSSSHPALKVVGGLLIAGGIGTGGYYAWDKWGRKARR